MRWCAVAAALLLAGCASTSSAPDTARELPPVTPPASEREAQADYATSLFMESCVAHVAKPDELTRWIEARALPKAESTIAAKILADEQGEVWSAASPMGAFFLIVVPIDPTVCKCAVWAHRADAKRMTEHFERLLRGTARPGLEVGPISDRTIDGAGGAYRQLVYFLRKEGAEVGFVFIATTSASEQAEIQGRLTVAPGQGRLTTEPGRPTPEE